MRGYIIAMVAFLVGIFAVLAWLASTEGGF